MQNDFDQELGVTAESKQRTKKEKGKEKEVSEYLSDEDPSWRLNWDDPLSDTDINFPNTNNTNNTNNDNKDNRDLLNVLKKKVETTEANTEIILIHTRALKDNSINIVGNTNMSISQISELFDKLSILEKKLMEMSNNNMIMMRLLTNLTRVVRDATSDATKDDDAPELC